MSHSTENNFEGAIYGDETLRHRQIRLLTILPIDDGNNGDSPIQCSLKPVFLDEEQPVYTALSYTWGHEHDRVRIEVNGEDFPATRNLHSALKHFRNTQDPIPTLWVDAICINQNHNNEKEEQVKFMQNIFSGAKETWAWLGHEANESSKAIDLINDLSNVYLNSCKNDKTDPEQADKSQWGSLTSRGLEKYATAMDHLLARNYWYRVWIVQEIVLSKNIIFFCGGRKFFWQSLLFCAYVLNEPETRYIHSAKHERNVSHGHGGGIQRILAIQSVRNDYQKNVEIGMRDSLLSLLSNHRATGATNAKDKFIALAGLARNVTEDHLADSSNSGGALRQNGTDSLYDKETKVGDVYTLACKFLIKERRHKPLDFLDSAGLPRNPDYPMSSWVPDWSVSKRRPSPLLYWQLPSQKHKDLVVINAPGKPRISKKSTSCIRGNGLLQAHGRQVGVIKGTITEPVHNQQHTHLRYPTGEPAYEILWKTLVLGRALNHGLEAPESWGTIFYHYISSPENPSSPHSVLRSWWQQCKHFKLCGSTLEEIVLAQSSSIPKPPPDSEEQLILFKSAFLIGVGYRKLATTEQGYLCLVPLDARTGDIVVILADCSAPVLVRRRGEETAWYQFIGTCYMHGIMHGELIDGLHIEDLFDEVFDMR
ncbi:HET domain containing protein [Hyaloscypha variabilis]